MLGRPLGVSEVKNRQTSMMADNQEKGEKTTVWNGHNKVKRTNKVSTESLEKMRKENIWFANKKKKMQIDDNKEGKNRHNSDHKVKNRKESTLSEREKNKEKLNKTHKQKMWTADSKERKIPSGQNKVKNGEMSTAFFWKEKKEKRLNRTNNEELQTDEGEEMLNYGSKVKNGKVATAISEEKKKKKPNNTYTEQKTSPNTPSVKEKRMRPIERPEIMMGHKPNGRYVPSNVSKEKKMDTSSVSNNKKRRREEPHTPFKKEKRMQSNDTDKKIQSGRVQEKKICGGGKENNRQSPFTFFKFMCYQFGEFMVIPSAVAPRFRDLTNHDVYLKDSEGVRSKVRLSVVGGSLAFHQGWDIFVSDHLIKWGEFLLFEHIAKETFNVRVFGIDSQERLYFKEDPERAEDRVGSGPAAQVNNNENLINRQCNTKGISPLRSKAKTVILISDSGASAHDEDVVNLTRSDADSTHQVAINTNKDPKRDQIGIGNLPYGECGTKCISPTGSEGETSSEIIVTNAAPLTHENYDRVGHELDEELISKEGIDSIPFDSITAVEKHQNHGKMNINQNFCRKYAVPVGFRCLEKWRKGIMNEAALDCTLIQPENTQEADSKLVDGYGSVGLNTVNEYFCSEGNHTSVPPVFTMPVKEPSSAARTIHDVTDMDHSTDEIGRGTVVQHETKMDKVEPVGSSVIQSSNIAMNANHVVAHVSEHCFSKQEGKKSINCAITESLLPMKDKILELDDHSLLKTSLQLCIHDITRKWIELPKSLSYAVKQKRQDLNIVMLKDPMKRLWPVLYYENPIFVGFTAGWKHFVAGNNLQIGDLCHLIKEPGDDETVYTVHMTRQ